MQAWGAETPPPSRPKAGDTKAAATPPEPEPAANTPLTFQFNLDPAHLYLAQRGLTAATVSHFGLGFASRGSMKGRIAIPIHDTDGQLVAYAGRWAGPDAELPAGEGKYKLPANFHKSLALYNLNRIPRSEDAQYVDEVILVEGFFSVCWLHQHGWPHVVAAMGSTLSPAQRTLLVERFDAVRIFFDGDEAGTKAARQIAEDLADDVWVKLVACPPGRQPDGVEPAELERLLR